MQIESNSAYLASLYRATHTAANEDTKQASTQAFSGSQETATTKAAPVTGVTGSNLSKEVMDQLIGTQMIETTQGNEAPKKSYEDILSEATEASQQINSSEGRHPLPGAIKHWMDNIANDSKYARKQVEKLGRGVDAILATTPPNGAPASEWMAFSEKLNSRLARAEDVKQQREAYYETLKSQGLPSAKIYAKLLEFNANLPENYGNGLDLTGATKDGWWQAEQQARFDYLQNLINQGKSATASAKPADSTKATG